MKFKQQEENTYDKSFRVTELAFRKAEIKIAAKHSEPTYVGNKNKIASERQEMVSPNHVKPK